MAYWVPPDSRWPPSVRIGELSQRSQFPRTCYYLCPGHMPN